MAKISKNIQAVKKNFKNEYKKKSQWNQYCETFFVLIKTYHGFLHVTKRSDVKRQWMKISISETVFRGKYNKCAVL